MGASRCNTINALAPNERQFITIIASIFVVVIIISSSSLGVM